MFDWGAGEKLPNGMLYEDTSVARYTITDGDPLSARVIVENTSASGRERLDGRHPGDGGDDLDGNPLHRHLQPRRLRRQYAHRRAHVDAEFPRDHC